MSEEERAKVGRILVALGDRLKVFGDVVLQARFFFGEEVMYDEKAFAKRVLAPGAVEKLEAYRAWLAERKQWDAATLEKETHDFLAEQGLGPGRHRPRGAGGGDRSRRGAGPVRLPGPFRPDCRCLEDRSSPSPRGASLEEQSG